MILPDANLLIYAYNSSMPQHRRSKAWFESAFSAGDSIALTWTTILAFLRITTDRRIFDPPIAMATSFDIVSSWLAEPNVVVVNPGDRYWEILGSLVLPGQVGGPLVMDAALAALAVEHGATLCTTDRDFARFPGLRTFNPLDT